MDANEYDLHSAAAAGDIDHVCRLLQLGNYLPNEPDRSGKTACFYAQLGGFPEIAHLLEEHGWTAMPEGNIFCGAGGRAAFWAWCPGVAQPSAAPSVTPQTKPPAPARWIDARRERHTCSSSPRALAMATSRTIRAALKKPAIATAPGKPTLPKSTPTKPRRPCLNRRDYADVGAHKKALVAAGRSGAEFDTLSGCPEWCAPPARAPRFPTRHRRILLLSLSIVRTPRPRRYEEPSDFEEAHEGSPAAGFTKLEEGAAPHAHSLIEVARFVIDCRPSRAADGSWVVVRHEDAADAAFCTPSRAAGGGVPLACEAAASQLPIPSMLESWPALGAAEGGEAATGREEGEVDDEWQHIFGEEGEEGVAVSEAAAVPRAWRGAETSLAAIHCGISGQTLVFKPRSRLVQAQAEAEGERECSALDTDDEAAREGRANITKGPAWHAEGDSSTISASAGLKDARHRELGSRCFSQKQVEKRMASKAHRTAQRAAVAVGA